MKFMLSITLITCAFSYDFLGNSTRIIKDSNLRFDEDQCCEEENCFFLGNGICDEFLNRPACNWDQGDCQACSPNCYLALLNNGICEEECFTPNCGHDFPDCASRENLEVYDPAESGDTFNLTINGKDMQVSGVVESVYENLSFLNTKSLSGSIDYTSSNTITNCTIEIEGDIKLKNFILGSDNFENFALIIIQNGSVELINFTISKNFEYSLEISKDQSLKIHYFEHEELSNSCLLSLKISYQGSKNKEILKFSQAEQATINFSASSSKDFQILDFKSLSEASLSFSLTSSNISIVNSTFISDSSHHPLFSLSNSSILLNNSIIKSNQIKESNANLYFALDRSNATVIDSILDYCQDLLQNLSSNSILEFLNCSFNSCQYSNLAKVSHVISCPNQNCETKYAFIKNCSDGEMDALGCKPCPDNYYRFKHISGQFCINCTDSMYCKSGQIWPKNGTFRMTEKDYSHVFRPCMNEFACKGYSEYSNNSNDHYTTCAEHYTGRFCGSCSRNADSSGIGSCEKCPEIKLNIFVIVLSIVIISCFIIYMIKSTVLASFEASEFYAIALRIGINYFQIIYLCLQFRIKWPGNKENKPEEDKTNSGDKVAIMYSIKCLLETLDADFSNKDYFYLKVGFMAMLPIIIFLFSLAYLAALKLYKVTRKKNIGLYLYRPITYSVPFLLIYPYVITYSLLPLACNSLVQNSPLYFDEQVDLDGYRYLMYNPDIKCNWEEHYRKIIWTTGFSLIVWGIGVPSFILYQLYQKRKNLFEFKVKYTFGFLISGYKHSNYYWEFLIFIKKLAIVFLTVFMQSGYSTTLQSVLLITLLIVGFILQLYYQPYITDDLNHLEIFGLLAAIITVLSAIVYTESYNKSTNLIVILTVILVVTNFLYIIYWASFLSKELMGYMVRNIEFLKKRFLKWDGFNREISKEFDKVNFVYIKEYQKLYTQAEFDITPLPNYLGENRKYENILKDIVVSRYKDYSNNRAPNIKALIRKNTFPRYSRNISLI